MDIAEMLFALLRLELCDIPVGKQVIDGVDSDALLALYKISNAHDIAHIVGMALHKIGKLSVETEVSAAFKKKMSTAMYRYERSRYELEQICRTLEMAEVPFVMLKGSVIRDFYKEPWYRTSCDIDILVHEEDLQRSIAQLKEKLNYSHDGKVNYHDAWLFSPSGVHLELHHNIKENDKSIDLVLDKVWDYCVKSENSQYRYKQTNEFLMFHILAHISYHFKGGGCGIRPLIDLLYLEKSVELDRTKFCEMLKQCNLTKFAENLKRLGKVWFEGIEHDDITRQMEDYILRGGVYGTVDNRIIVTQQQKGGKLGYFLSRAFLPYETIKFSYPILQKHKWLLPLMQVRRWFRLLFSGKTKQAAKEFNVIQSVSNEDAKRMQKFLKDVGF